MCTYSCIEHSFLRSWYYLYAQKLYTQLGCRKPWSSNLQWDSPHGPNPLRALFDAAHRNWPKQPACFLKARFAGNLWIIIFASFLQTSDKAGNMAFVSSRTPMPRQHCIPPDLIQGMISSIVHLAFARTIFAAVHALMEMMFGWLLATVSIEPRIRAAAPRNGS